MRVDGLCSSKPARTANQRGKAQPGLAPPVCTCAACPGPLDDGGYVRSAAGVVCGLSRGTARRAPTAQRPLSRALPPRPAICRPCRDLRRGAAGWSAAVKPRQGRHTRSPGREARERAAGTTLSPSRSAGRATQPSLSGSGAPEFNLEALFAERQCPCDSAFGGARKAGQTGATARGEQSPRGLFLPLTRWVGSGNIPRGLKAQGLCTLIA